MEITNDQYKKISKYLPVPSTKGQRKNLKSSADKRNFVCRRKWGGGHYQKNMTTIKNGKQSEEVDLSQKFIHRIEQH